MKPFKYLCVLLAMLSVLSGCTFPSGDDLLAAPQASANYKSLEEELKKIQATQNYTAPIGGQNRSTVQLADLDGDGVDEAISFFASNPGAGGSQYSVYIHKKQDEAYVTTGSIVGAGVAIQSVEYPVIAPDGRRGIVIAWKQSTEGTGALSVCTLNQEGAPKVLLETEYTAMELADLDGDGAQDLLLLGADESGKRAARLYQYQRGELVLAGTAPTNAEAVSVMSMTGGRVANHTPAVFAEEKTESGVGLMTDIFVFSDGQLHNITLDGEAAATFGTYRPVSVYARDINADGITELPRATLMAGYENAAAADALFMLDWYVYGPASQPQRVMTTYQNVSEEWQFTIDNAWHDQITAVKSSESGLTAVHFSQYVNANQSLPLFSIYCATGTLRDTYASRQNVIQLAETDKAVFFARIDDVSGQAGIRIDESGIRARFKLIATSWNT